MRLKRFTAGYFILGTFAAVLALMLAFHQWILSDYTENLLSLQENHLLATVKSVASSLQQYYQTELESFDLYFDGEVSETQICKFLDGYTDVSAIAVIDAADSIRWRQGTDYDQVLTQQCGQFPAEGSGAQLLSPMLNGENSFIQLVVKPISWDQEPCWICAVIETQSVYQQVVEPVQIGQEGYSMVKQWDGTILMHPTRGQVGLNAISGRLELYGDEQIDLTDLEKLLSEQQENTEGSRILNSYWWEDENGPVEAKKLVAYTQITVGTETWIVNCTLDYDEVMLPLEKMQRYSFGVSLFLLLAFAAVLAAILTWQHRQKTMELEMSHLTELHAKDEQLRHKDKIQTLGTMASAVSHEFRNFLTPILLYTDILLCDEQISPDNKNMVQEIQNSAAQAKTLTEELSQYAHSGRGDQQRVPILVTEKAQRALFWVQKTLPENITLVTKLDASDGFCLMGSQGMIRQIVINLCNNAVHAMGKNKGTLKVTGRLLAEEKRYVISVWDDGPPIPDQMQAEIFTPFFSTKKVGEGTGLGLPIVQNLLHEIGGEITLRSSEEQGTQFDVILPLTAQSEEDHA